MGQERFSTGKTPQVSIAECQGNLVIRGWSESDVLVKGDNYEANESDTGLSVNSRSDLKLMVPAETDLSVASVDGDLVVKHVEGDISLINAARDVVLNGLTNVKINTIDGDLSAKNIDGVLSVDIVAGDAALRNVGDITLGSIQGDAALRNVNGAVQLEQVQGDLALRTVNGDVSVMQGQRDAALRNLGGQTMLKNIQGDIRIYGGLAAGEHTFNAEGDIVLRWPANAPLELVATAPKIVNRLQFDQVVEADNTLTGRISDGQTSVSLAAGGRIELKETHIVDSHWENELFDEADFDFDFGVDIAGLGERIGKEVNQHIARVTSDIETRFGPDFTQRLSEKIARKAERAAERAERAAERARQRAERNMRRRGRWSSPPPAPPQPSKKKKATSAEQLKILRMVEKGIITPDEANTLLEALEE
ncbi:MAG TPA: DUF4097 family beta strand repeat-containing protein [Anaerolineae bacterium]